MAAEATQQAFGGIRQMVGKQSEPRSAGTVPETEQSPEAATGDVSAQPARWGPALLPRNRKRSDHHNWCS